MPEIQMPKLSDTMTEGTLVSWKKKKGDKVSTGDVIAEIETDKETMEWESPEDCTLTEIYVEEGGKVNVGDKIAFIGEQDEEAPAAEEKKEEAGEGENKEEPAAKAKGPEKEKAQKETEKPAPHVADDLFDDDVAGDRHDHRREPEAYVLVARQVFEDPRGAHIEYTAASICESTRSSAAPPSSCRIIPRTRAARVA